MGIDTGSQPTDRAGTVSDVCVVGLGYVGLRLATEFDAADHSVEGYDVDPEKIRQLGEGTDPTGEIPSSVLEEGDVEFTDEPTCIGWCDYVVIAVPTPVDDANVPDMSLVLAAGRTVGEHLTRGTTVVLESTVYPGATQEELVPALEASSGMIAGEDFSVGYSPERVVPGDDGRDLEDIVKIVSAQDDETLDDLRELYGSIVDAGLHEAPTIETAEAAKCLENTQRDLNIGLVNEFAVACRRTDLDMKSEDVLEAAGTKWNFHDYWPGLVGGHCLPVDPYFLVHAFEEEGFSPSLIRTARSVNESIPEYVAETTVDALEQRPQAIVPEATGEGADRHDRRDRVLVAGLAYKPNTSDLRSSAIATIVERLGDSGVDVVGADPHCDAAAAEAEFGIPVQEGLSADGFDALVVPTPHDELRDLDVEALGDEMNDRPVLVDVRGAFDGDAARDADFIYRRL